MNPVSFQVPEAGSYNCALARIPGPTPPATSTFPFASNVAVCNDRMFDGEFVGYPVMFVMDPVGSQVPVAGSYSSALPSEFWLLSAPPTTSTRPSSSRLAV